MTIFTDKAKVYVPRLMKDLNITRVQACGIFGNLGTETGGFKHLQEISPVVKGSRGGYGWMQWTGPRRKKYEAWAQSKNLIPSLDETNYQYLVHETLTDEKHSLVQLRKTTTPEAAAYTFMKLNLRPGVEHVKSREDYARKADEATRLAIAETPKEVKQDEKAINQTTGAGATGIVTILLAFLTDHPFIVLGTGAAIAFLVWIGVGMYQDMKEKERQEAVARIQALQKSTKQTQKGKKKNG